MSKSFRREIYGAKININQNIFHQEYETLIPLIGKAILNSSKVTYETKYLKWVFVNAEPIVIDNKEYIIGKICKVKKIVIEKKYDEMIHDTYTSNAINKAYESVFLFDAKSEILAFEETSDIDKKTFINVFEKLCYLSDNTLGQIRIELYPRASEIDDILNNISKVYYAKFNIIPANHTSKKGFKKLDELVKEEKISNLSIILKNEDGEISREQDTLFSQCMEMAKGAYGTFKINIKEKNNNRKKVVDSEHTVYKASIEYKEDISEYIGGFHQLVEQIKADRKL